MPRAPRIDIPDLTYHIINRGVKQLPLFQDDEDRLEFMDWLKETRRRYALDIHQYSLMTNHYHLLLKTFETSLSKAMQFFASRFAFWFNKNIEIPATCFRAAFTVLSSQMIAITRRSVVIFISILFGQESSDGRKNTAGPTMAT